jgi:CHAT domain-containing protein/Tfp pilus assembly protein PilF
LTRDAVGRDGRRCVRLRAERAALWLFVLVAPAAGCSRTGEQAPPPVQASGVAEADRHFEQGESLREQQQYDRARDELEEARSLYERAQSWEGYARSRNALGAVASGKGAYGEALDHAKAALGTARERLGETHVEVARSYRVMGSVFAATGRYAEALDVYEKALRLPTSTADGRDAEVAEVYNGIGWVRSEQGKDDEALAAYEKALSIQLTVLGTDHPKVAVTYILTGSALWGKGDYDRAIASFEKGVSILLARKDAPRRTLAAAYINMGNAYWSKGDYDQTLEYYEKALPLQVAVLGEKHPDVGGSHRNLALVHLQRGDYDASIESIGKALAIYVSAFGERHAMVAQCYSAAGAVRLARGEPDRALPLVEKALSIQLSLPERNARDTAVIYSTVADACKATGSFARAAVFYQKALDTDRAAVGERHPDVAEDYLNLGKFRADRGDLDGALRFYQKAVLANDPHLDRPEAYLDPPLETAYSEEFLLDSLKGAASALARRYAARPRQPEDLAKAVTVYEHASRLIERMRSGYRAEGSKLALARKTIETYDDAIQAALDLHRATGDERHLETAFRFAEKSRAGILLDAVNEAAARQFAGIPGELLERERQLRIDIAALDRRVIEAELDPGAGEDASRSEDRNRLFDRKREYEALLHGLEEEHPRYFDLKYRFATASSREIRERLLDERTALVEYFVGRERLFVFVVTKRGLSASSVAKDAAFEKAVEDLRGGIAEQDFARYARSARQLYETLLAPVEGVAAGKDLVVVPDGPLSTIPFEALLTRDVGTASGWADAGSLPYLIRDRAARYAYSATMLLTGLRRETAPPEKDYVAFAPVFSAGRPESEGGTRSPGGPRSPLPASRDEVNNIRGLFRERYGPIDRWLSQRSRVYLEGEATEENLKHAGLEHYRYVHLATHGVVDEKHPRLSGLLFMESSRSAEDGVLHLGEIYNLSLNADLVVLSACETGLGQLARGEGVIGLTRGFLYAGASSVLVSLWRVADAATAALMADFYGELLAGRPGAQALREAKLRAIRRDPESAKPYSWSAFVLIGGDGNRPVAER